MDTEIKGTPCWEANNHKARKLEGEYQALLAEERELERQMQKLRAKRIDLRMKEADNVMDFVRSYSGKLTPHDIDVYLCHCQNMLFGNIDGTFLTFSDPTKED